MADLPGLHQCNSTLFLLINAQVGSLIAGCTEPSVSAEPSLSQACEGIPDTEQQASPSTTAQAGPPPEAAIPAAPGTNSSCAFNSSTALSASDADVPQAKQQSQEQQQQQQQQQRRQQQQQLQPPKSACSSSIGSPGTSFASRAFVIEDSDSESDFQPLKPARHSTGSFQSAQQTGKLSGYRSVHRGNQGVVPVKLMSRHPRGTTVKEHHSLGSKGIQFAEQVQVMHTDLSVH